MAVGVPEGRYTKSFCGRSFSRKERPFLLEDELKLEAILKTKKENGNDKH